ncbi:MAG: hypothetical protein HY841_02245 [Bacteroidetes bacterium]|nr:hypothetical protein [Bacteroidota bacterium]
MNNFTKIFPSFFLFTVYCLLPTSFCFSQNPDIKRTYHWYFGNQAGLDFSSGSAVPDVNGVYNNFEGCATFSDTAGNLLFYTDGETVYNKNHQAMQNGTNIGGCWSATQGALIAPEPNNDSIFFVFTTGCATALATGLRYSVINMK